MEHSYAKYQLDRSLLCSPLQFGDLSLLQIGRLHLSPGGQVDVHTHLNWFELTVATDGEGTVYTNGAATKVARGDIVLSFPGDFHAIVSETEKPLKFDYIAFWAEEGELKSALFGITRRAGSAESRIFRDERIDALLLDALAEMDGKDGLSEEIIAASLRHIVLRVIRDFAERQTVKRTADTDSRKELCYAVMNYVDSHVFSMRGLDSLGREMGYRYSYLSEVFRKTTGDTLAHYFRDRRLEAARLLLAEGRMTVSEVAERLGYSSVYSFSRSFKTVFGVPPSRAKSSQK